MRKGPDAPPGWFLDLTSFVINLVGQKVSDITHNFSRVCVHVQCAKGASLKLSLRLPLDTQTGEFQIGARGVVIEWITSGLTSIITSAWQKVRVHVHLVMHFAMRCSHSDYCEKWMW